MRGPRDIGAEVPGKRPSDPDFEPKSAGSGRNPLEFAKDEGYPSVKHGRDFELSGRDAELNVTKTLFDMRLASLGL